MCHCSGATVPEQIRTRMSHFDPCVHGVARRPGTYRVHAKREGPRDTKATASSLWTGLLRSDPIEHQHVGAPSLLLHVQSPGKEEMDLPLELQRLASRPERLFTCDTNG